MKKIRRRAMGIIILIGVYLAFVVPLLLGLSPIIAIGTGLTMAYLADLAYRRD